MSGCEQINHFAEMSFKVYFQLIQKNITPPHPLKLNIKKTQYIKLVTNRHESQ